MTSYRIHVDSRMRDPFTLVSAPTFTLNKSIAQVRGIRVKWCSFSNTVYNIRMGQNDRISISKNYGVNYAEQTYISPGHYTNDAAQGAVGGGMSSGGSMSSSNGGAEETHTDNTLIRGDLSCVNRCGNTGGVGLCYGDERYRAHAKHNTRTYTPTPAKSLGLTATLITLNKHAHGGATQTAHARSLTAAPSDFSYSLYDL